MKGSTPLTTLTSTHPAGELTRRCPPCDFDICHLCLSDPAGLPGVGVEGELVTEDEDGWSAVEEQSPIVYLSVCVAHRPHRPPPSPLPHARPPPSPTSFSNRVWCDIYGFRLGCLPRPPLHALTHARVCVLATCLIISPFTLHSAGARAVFSFGRRNGGSRARDAGAGAARGSGRELKRQGTKERRLRRGVRTTLTRPFHPTPPGSTLRAAAAAAAAGAAGRAGMAAGRVGRV